MRKISKGFTLVELLIVIAILAVLSTATVVVLNPAELLKQARDSQRISDIANLNSALSFYVSTSDSPTFTAGPFSSTAGTSDAGDCGFTNVTPPVEACTVRAIFLTDGTGWVGVDLDSLTTGSPIARLPQDPTQDPTNSTDYFYAYKGDNANKVWEIDGRLESTKYKGQMATDGGNRNTCVTYVENTCFYETGTDPGLDL
jgi:prepilin-type N-terminal cleavage/methylation domain-containing protein